MTYDFDLFVIGAGSGGVRASRTAAVQGVKVAVAEEGLMGGTCVNVGCVPKKLFTYASHYAHDFKDAKGYGWSVGKTSFDWKVLIKNKDAEISRLNGIYRNMLNNSGVTLIDGRAIFKDDHTVIVNGTEYTAEKILITCGSTPFVPNIEGAELGGTSFEAFYLDTFPKRVLVIGGGYIAVEFAGIFNGLGADVKLTIRKDLILNGFDEDIRAFAQEQIKINGVDILTGVSPTKLEKTDTGTLVTMSHGSTVEADFVMWATGRVPYTQNMGLENTSLKLNDDGSIEVDETFKSNAKSIYALGDVINRFQLTPVALGEAMVFVDQNYGSKTREMHYENIPTAVFSDPSIGTCGISEQDATAQGYDVQIFKSEFRAMKNTLSGSPIRTLMKLVVDRKTDTVLGAHMVGDDAGEIMQGIGIAMVNGLTKANFDACIGIHPSSAEEFVTMRTPVN